MFVSASGNRKPGAGKEVVHRSLRVLAACLLVSALSGSGMVSDAIAQPVVAIQTPVDGSSVPYRGGAVWAIYGGGGGIVRSEYALDPPDVFTADEVLHPEDYPGITIQVVPGPGPDSDTLRVSKDDGGTVYTFDWIETPDTSRNFVFTAPYPDSAVVGCCPAPSGDYYGLHELYVRALDGNGAYGGTGSSFKALNHTPQSVIASPDLSGQTSSSYIYAGPNLQVVPAGTDADTPDSPAGYLYKLLRVDTLDPPPPLYLAPISFLFTRGGPWIYESTDAFPVQLSLEPGGEYLLGVRAVDADGAAEPFLDIARNVVKIKALAVPPSPTILLDDLVLGPIQGSGTGTVEEATVPRGVALHIQVACSAAAYGGVCAGNRWGIDLPDPDGETGWSAWADRDVLPEIRFADPGDHTLYVEARDSQGSVSRLAVVLHVVPMPFDRSTLWVDDLRSLGGTVEPTDQTVDAFWRQLFDNSGRFGGTPSDSVWTYNCYGLNDAQYLPPRAPDLGLLGRYRLLIWYADLGYNGLSALYQSTGYRNRNLQAYMAAGGQLWVVGSQTVAGMMRGGTSAPNSYPLAPTPGDFAYDFMKLASGRIENALAGNRLGTRSTDNMIGADPYPGLPVIYPQLQQDSTRWNPFRKAIPFADAVFDPIRAENIPGFTGVIDSLYIYKAVEPTSAYNNRLTAIRWHDMNPNPSQGAVQWFGFDLYWMKPAQAQEVFNRSIDWFRSAEQPIPVRLSSFTVTRAPEGAVLRWSVAEATDHAGFDVYRQVGAGERVKLNDGLVSGSTHYEFVDAEAPATAADYWLAERARSGGTTWLGPVTLAAAEARFAFAMAPASPNPFREATRIAYTLPRATQVRVDVFDVQGRRVATLVDGTEPAGAHETNWDGRLATGGRAAAGFYLIRLRAGEQSQVRKALLMK